MHMHDVWTVFAIRQQPTTVPPGSVLKSNIRVLGIKNIYYHFKGIKSTKILYSAAVYICHTKGEGRVNLKIA